MIFSKTFGYALRGVLYIAFVQDQKRLVQIDEIADRLGVPRHFLSKILKRLVQARLLVSVKGPYGGYGLAADTLQTPLLRLEELTDGLDTFKNCVLRLQACNSVNPCPLHTQMERIKGDLRRVMEGTSIGALLQHDKKQFINSIATYEFTGMPDKNENQ